MPRSQKQLKEGQMTRAQTLGSIKTRLRRIAKTARENPEMVFTNLAHNIDLFFLGEAYKRTRKGGAVGVDGVRGKDYRENLTENLKGLLERMKSREYKPPNVRRATIPKDDGGARPIGITTFEDKVAQQSVAMLLGAVYEQDFLNCSFGFRPNRSQHQAIHEVWEGIMRMKGGWVVEVDIKGFFTNLSHKHLRKILDLRIQDRSLRTFIDRWIRAGVLDEGVVTIPEAGTPQGGVISPILSNIYLHEVLDKWFENVVKPRLKGYSFLVRYCDDFVIVCSTKSDAERLFDVLPKRFGKYGLSIHEKKSKIVDFRRPPCGKKAEGSFDFLGFRHYWSRSRKGVSVVKRKTASSRLAKAAKKVDRWCKKNRHKKVREQHSRLCSMLRGHYNYYGIQCNYGALKALHQNTRRSWQKWLNRRSQKAKMNWEKMAKLLERWPLPPPRIVHFGV